MGAILGAVVFILSFWAFMFAIVWAMFHVDGDMLASFRRRLPSRLQQRLQRFQIWTRDPGNRTTLVIIVLAIAAIFVGLIGLYRPSATVWNDIAPELIGIAVTVLIVDVLYRRRDAQREKQRIIEQMGSPVNDAALEAVRIARMHGWLKDGSLTGVSLVKANLQMAKFGPADMRSADLRHAQLQHTEMRRAKLACTKLQEANLSNADLRFTELRHALLGKTDLSEANLYGADLSRADLREANLTEADLRTAMLDHTIYDFRTKWPHNCTHPSAAQDWDQMNAQEQEDWWMVNRTFKCREPF